MLQLRALLASASTSTIRPQVERVPWRGRQPWLRAGGRRRLTGRMGHSEGSSSRCTNRPCGRLAWTSAGAATPSITESTMKRHHRGSGLIGSSSQSDCDGATGRRRLALHGRQYAHGREGGRRGRPCLSTYELALVRGRARHFFDTAGRNLLAALRRPAWRITLRCPSSAPTDCWLAAISVPNGVRKATRPRPCPDHRAVLRVRGGHCRRWHAGRKSGVGADSRWRLTTLPPRSPPW